jgi:hypothetical protein
LGREKPVILAILVNVLPISQDLRHSDVVIKSYMNHYMGSYGISLKTLSS